MDLRSSLVKTPSSLAEGPQDLSAPACTADEHCAWTVCGLDAEGVKGVVIVLDPGPAETDDLQG